MGKIEKKISEFSDKIAREFKPNKIILFGSYAWGEPNSDSDIDLFIIKDTHERRIDRSRRVRKIIWDFGMPVDILVYTPQEVKQRMELEDFFIEDILNKGKVLYTEFKK